MARFTSSSLSLCNNAAFFTAGTVSNNIGGVTLSNTRILAAAGTAAAPSYSFAGDLGVGMFDAGANILGLATAGLQRMTILSNGNVGIGTPAPAYPLDVSGVINAGRAGNVNQGNVLLEPFSWGTTGVGLPETIVGQTVFQANGPYYTTVRGVISNNGFNDGIDLRFTTDRATGINTQADRMTIRALTGHVGIGTTNPAYALDVCSSAGVASVNMRTWPRFPVTNVLMAIAQLTQLGGLNGGAYNFSNPIQTMDTNLITFTASNASVGASFIIRRSGLWNINFLFHTGNAQYVFIDVSTGNVASNSYGSNGTRPIAFGGQGGGGVNMVTYTGYLPSNASYLYKFRGGSNLTTVGLGTNTLQITFLGETPDSAAAFPF
jgi:hypothetical protein